MSLDQAYPSYNQTAPPIISSWIFRDESGDTFHVGVAFPEGLHDLGIVRLRSKLLTMKFPDFCEAVGKAGGTVFLPMEEDRGEAESE